MRHKFRWDTPITENDYNVFINKQVEAYYRGVAAGMILATAAITLAGLLAWIVT